jgi:competence protein ComEA
MRLRKAVMVLAPALFAWATVAQTLPDGPGKELVETICSACHSLTNITTQQKTKEEWRAKVTEMLQEETDVTGPERESIVTYLAEHFPKAAKINVNKARANELAAALDLTPKAAEAIVRYRDEKGSFKTLDDLKKVPGVDSAKIDANKDRVQF